MPILMSQKYKRLSLIGSGSYGQAWLVMEQGTGNKYVAKVIKVARLTEKEMDQSITEVMVLARCNHRNIIRYVEAFVGDAALHIVMEYANGGDLHRRIQKQNGIYFSPETILNWFVQIVAALEYIHSRNILHRDLKSQNVFLTSAGLVKLGDFGIARVLQRHEDHALTTIGTPFYISPEICQKKPYNAKTDMWAAGCLLYEVCLLRVPFSAPDFTGLVVQILQCQYDPVPSYFGPAIQHLIRHLLIVQPSRRLSARELLTLTLVRPFVETQIHVHQQQKGQRSRSLVSIASMENDINKSSTDNPDGRSERRGHRPRSLIRNIHKNSGKDALHPEVQRSYSQNNIPRSCDNGRVRDHSIDSKNRSQYSDSGSKAVNADLFNRDCDQNSEFVDQSSGPACNVSSSVSRHEGRRGKGDNKAESPEKTPDFHVKQTYIVSNPVFRRLSQASPYLGETVRRQRESLTIDDRKAHITSLQRSNQSAATRQNIEECGRDIGDDDDVFDIPSASAAKATPRNTGGRSTQKDETCDIRTCMDELDRVRLAVDQPRRRSMVDSRTYIINSTLNNNNNNNKPVTVDVTETQFLAASVVNNNPTQARQILIDAVTMAIGNEKASKMVAMVTRALDNGQSYQEICDALGNSDGKYLPLILANYMISVS